MKKEIRFRLVKHLTFLENELKDHKKFLTLSWKQYNDDSDKRRNVERWVENIINSSVDIAKIILTSEKITLPDTYKDTVKTLSLVEGFDAKLMDKLSDWVPLRNIISHEYLDIRWSSIKKFISESNPLFEDLLRRTKAYIEKEEQSQDSENTA